MATRAKRQHLSAQSYLRRFANGNDQVTVYDKRTGAEYTTSIANVEVEANFYTVPGPDGAPTDVIEKFIASEIEGRAVDAFDRLVADRFPPTPEDRRTIAEFMALQMVRGRAFRNMHDESAERAAAKEIKPRIELTPEENERLQRTAGAAFLQMATAQPFRMGTMLEMAEKTLPYLLDAAWVLVRTAHAPTSDLPVIPWEEKTKTAGFFIGLSVATEINFAVSPERVLVLNRRKPPLIANVVADAPEGWRKQFPGLVMQTAQRYVYRRPGTELGGGS